MFPNDLLILKNILNRLNIQVNLITAENICSIFTVNSLAKFVINVTQNLQIKKNNNPLAINRAILTGLVLGLAVFENQSHCGVKTRHLDFDNKLKVLNTNYCASFASQTFAT